MILEFLKVIFAAILSENSIQYVLLIFSFARLGAKLVPLNLKLNTTDWKRQLEIFKLDKILVSAHYSGKLDSENIQLIPIAEIFASIQSSNVSVPGGSSETECVGIFSSGTEGEDKLIFIKINALTKHSKLSNSSTGFSAENTWILSLPLYHIGGFAVPWRAADAGGNTILHRFLCCGFYLRFYKR